MKAWFNRILDWLPKRLPKHLATGRAGEQAARKHLEKSGLKFLLANFRSKRGEIDLILPGLHFLQIDVRSEISVVQC